MARCMGLTGFFDSDIPEEQGIEVLRKALELGVTTFNTAVRTCARCAQAEEKSMVKRLSSQSVSGIADHRKDR
jgi:hypothetical protein